MPHNTTATSDRSSGTHTEPTDLYVTRFANPHTAIPDWLICTSTIRLEIRHMAAVIMILSKRGLPPTKAEIAEVCGVEPRTIQRWLAELHSAGVLSFQLVGKRRMYVFHEIPTISDPSISDPGVSDRMASSDPSISDRGIIHEGQPQPAIHGNAGAMNRRSWKDRISDRAGSGGSPIFNKESIPPTTSAEKPPKISPDQITTPTGRWLVKQGFNLVSAFHFQGIPLKVAQADYERRWELGARNGAIINAWSVELPELGAVGEVADPVTPESRRAELQAKYGDLFRFGDDISGLGSEEPECSAQAQPI